MAVAHDWSNLEKQRDPVQTSTYAQPTATDICFKAAAFILLINWLIVVFSLHHSIQHYCLKNRGIFARNQKFLQHTPWMFGLTIPLSGATVAYNILCSFDFSVSLPKGKPQSPTYFIFLGAKELLEQYYLNSWCYGGH